MSTRGQTRCVASAEARAVCLFLCLLVSGRWWAARSRAPSVPEGLVGVHEASDVNIHDYGGSPLGIAGPVGEGAVSAAWRAPRTFLEWCGGEVAYIVVVFTIVGFAFGFMFGPGVYASLTQPAGISPAQTTQYDKTYINEDKLLEENQVLINKLFEQEQATLQERIATGG